MKTCKPPLPHPWRGERKKGFIMLKKRVWAAGIKVIESQEEAVLTGGMIRWYHLKKRETMRGENFKKVTVAENRFEADLISQTLQQEGIPCLIRSYHDTAYDGIFIPQKGWGAIMVPEELEEKAGAIIAELRQGLKDKELSGEIEENSPS
jgi:hypothetical protein